MKPKTILQKRVVELSKKLRPITEKQLQWGYEKCLDKNVTRSKKKLYCLNAGTNGPTIFRYSPTLIRVASVRHVVKNC